MTIPVNTPARTSEAIITNYILKEFGCFIVVSDDRLFVNVLRRTIVTELGLPSACLVLINNQEHILRNIRELSIRRKEILLFIQTQLNYKNIDDIITQIALKIRNCKIVIVTTESELPQLALLRERGLAENWITKPIAINQLIAKVALIIKPHGQLYQLIQAAEDYLAKGSYRHVLTICRKIFETHPDNPVAYMLMGDAFKGLEQEENMITAYEHASYSDQLFMEPISKLVSYFQDKKNNDKVIQYIERLDVMSPLNMERKIELAKLQLESGNDIDAKETFEAAIKVQNKRMKEAISATATQIGTIYLEKGNPEAEVYFRKAIEVYDGTLGKSHMHLFNDLGIALRKLGKWREAVAEYDKAIAICPDDEVLYYNAALAYDEGEDKQKASQFIHTALRINPPFYKNNYLASYNIGMILSKTNETDEAMKYINHSLSINPDYECAKTLKASLIKSGVRG
jgi:tetratricopeptide (TPR) repeat protein